MNLSVDQWITIIGNVAGGFSGAIFALVFLAFSTSIGKIIKRKITHYNSLVILETELNEMIGIIKDDIYLLPNFIDAIRKGNIYWSQIRIIPVNKSHLNDLLDIGLINELFEFDYKIRKVNDDIENLTTGYNELKDAYIHKYIKVGHYIQNALITAEQINLIEIFLEDLEENLINLLVKVRIQARKDEPLMVKIQRFFNKETSSKLTMKEFEVEKDKIEQELDESSKKSRKEIKMILKKKDKI